MTSNITGDGRRAAQLSASGHRPRLVRLTLAALGLLMCGGWTTASPAAVATPPAIVVRARPVDDSVLTERHRYLMIKAGAGAVSVFFLRGLLRRRSGGGDGDSGAE